VRVSNLRQAAEIGGAWLLNNRLTQSDYRNQPLTNAKMLYVNILKMSIFESFFAFFC